MVIYTVFKWSPGAILADFVPHRLHHGIKRFLWRTEAKDTFPVQNKMNTRGALRRQFAAAEMEEVHFDYLDDCRTFARFRVTQWIELAVMRALRLFGLHYPELCIVGVYEKGGV